MNFEELRKEYPIFIYKSYKINWEEENLELTFNFEIPGLETFSPKTIIPRRIITNQNIDENILKTLVFHIGLIEMLSYYKCCCPKEIQIPCGHLEEEQIKFLKKLIYYGLGEFFYTNNIFITEEELVEIKPTGTKLTFSDKYPVKEGILIPVGGGKDSCVSLEILKNQNITPIVQNPKEVMKNCIQASNLNLEDAYTFTREVCKEQLKELHTKGFLNGHTPFSSLLAFELYLIAYLSNKKYIALSNENSANEGTVLGTKINHQYSKSYEFEQDFNNYTKKYLPLQIKYFSFLRPLNEFQIGMLFSKYENYHHVFRSCNVGSKQNNWSWCGMCPKCLFVYIILSPYLYKEKLVSIFNKDLFEDENLLPVLKELLGETGVKPFECVGEVSEVKYALSLLLSNYKEPLPILLKYYKDNHPIDITPKLERKYSKEHLVPKELEQILKKELDKYV